MSKNPSKILGVLRGRYVKLETEIYLPTGKFPIIHESYVDKEGEDYVLRDEEGHLICNVPRAASNRLTFDLD